MLLACGAALVAGAAPAQAASPRLDQVSPRGGQRGTTVELTLKGERLQDAEALLFHGPGLAQRGLTVVDGKTVKVQLELAPDCPLGEHALRLRCRSGLSELRTFFVGALRQVAEDEKARGPQEIELEVTVEGAIGGEDQDAFAFQATAGQRITAEVEAMRLGGPFFDPVLVLADASGAELARADDHPLTRQDPLLSFTIPADGRYLLTLRDAAWEGSERHRYRLHLGTFPAPAVAFPERDRPGLQAFAGRIDRPGQVAEHRFAATKGTRLRIRSLARAFGSPLDPVLELLDAKGKGLGSNDDVAGRPDAEMVQAIPADGEYTLRVKDFQGRGGETFVYRVEVAPVGSALSLEPASYGRNSQERSALVVPRGNRMALLLRVGRENVNGPVAVALEDLPAGLAVIGSPICTTPAGAVAVVVEATPDAPLAAGLLRVRGTSGETEADFGQAIPLTTGYPNDTVYHSRRLDRFAAAVVEPAPFRVRLVEPKLPLVPGGVAELAVHVEREAGFKGPVFVSLLLDPPGVSSQKNVKLDPKETRQAIPLTASAQAAAGRWPLVVVARGDRGGDTWVASAPVELAVEPPFVKATLNRSAGPRGGTLELAGELALERPLPTGQASARLIGLPAHCVAPVVSLSATSKTLVFPIALGAQAKQGKHRNIVCEVRIPHEDGEIVQRLAPTAFRIDPPAADPPPAPAGEKPARPLTRLERLRAEHAARKAREAEEAP